MCFKKIQIKTSTCNTCCNSVFSWSQWGNAELNKLMIWPMAGKPRRGHHLAPLLPACLPGAQPPKLAPSWAALDNHLHLTCSPPRAVVAIPPRLSYPNTVLALLCYSHASICGSERSIIHSLSSLITPNYCPPYNNLVNSWLLPCQTVLHVPDETNLHSETSGKWHLGSRLSQMMPETKTKYWSKAGLFTWPKDKGKSQFW